MHTSSTDKLPQTVHTEKMPFHSTDAQSRRQSLPTHLDTGNSESSTHLAKAFRLDDPVDNRGKRFQDNDESADQDLTIPHEGVRGKGNEPRHPNQSAMEQMDRIPVVQRNTTSRNNGRNSAQLAMIRKEASRREGSRRAGRNRRIAITVTVFDQLQGRKIDVSVRTKHALRQITISWPIQNPTTSRLLLHHPNLRARKVAGEIIELAAAVRHACRNAYVKQWPIPPTLLRSCCVARRCSRRGNRDHRKLLRRFGMPSHTTTRMLIRSRNCRTPNYILSLYLTCADSESLIVRLVLGRSPINWKMHWSVLPKAVAN